MEETLLHWKIFFPNGALYHPKNSEPCHLFNALISVPALLGPSLTREQTGPRKSPI